MKKLALFGLLLLFFCFVTASSSAISENENAGLHQSTENKLVGAWRLVSLEEPDAQGIIHKTDCTGQLVFTRDGHLSVQVMYRNTERGGQGGPVQYAQGGYEASFGRHEVDERAHVFTFHVEGAMVRNLIGKDLPRAFEISGNQMIVNSTNSNEHWRVMWERF